MQATSVQVMRRFTRQDLIDLAAIENEPCISIYMPTERATPSADEARIRLKNLLREAEKTVSEAEGTKQKSLLAMIEEGRRLITDSDFWQRRSEGLAIFMTAEWLRAYQLPERFEESVSVAERFRVKPLLPLFMADGRFYVLALSQSAIRLLDCTRHSVVELDAEDLPGGMDETLGYDSKEAQLQFHTGAAGGGGARPAMFHGHGVSIDDKKDEIRRYFRSVDQALAALLKEPEVPLVLAGVDYLIPIFREASDYRWIMAEAVRGNPDNLRPEELHEQALPVVRPELERSLHEARERYQALAGKGSTAAGVQTVVPAAANGQVETLFISLEARKPGTFDRERNEAIVSQDEASAGDGDLLDLAALEAIRHGSRVYALASDDMPARDAAAAAILRY